MQITNLASKTSYPRLSSPLRKEYRVRSIYWSSEMWYYLLLGILGSKKEAVLEFQPLGWPERLTKRDFANNKTSESLFVICGKRVTFCRSAELWRDMPPHCQMQRNVISSRVSVGDSCNSSKQYFRTRGRRMETVFSRRKYHHSSYPLASYFPWRCFAVYLISYFPPNFCQLIRHFLALHATYNWLGAH